ncbi:hypothetical protein [Geitlerinema sp. PCC 7407]|uniref:hypothetical protein n=1 Tax=Geitlerinema sp. PCC 7407 TaxID=1173025 RepID=UPI00029F9E3D|nr:hypothetical protein [Geitlerinema sp. PCC 7407]AFY68160.1 hypothetical protein GEI7407_3693 [Geitlerinema sp. PCC 7407]
MLTGTFIPPELAIAPSPAAMVNGLQLRTVLVDHQSSFELWYPTQDLLAVNEASLLMSDFARLETIAKRLTWLMGATCFVAGQQISLHSTDSWGQVQTLLANQACRPNAMIWEYQGQTIRPVYENQRHLGWMMQSPCWKISLMRIEGGLGRSQIEVLPVTVQIGVEQSVVRRFRGTRTAGLGEGDRGWLAQGQAWMGNVRRFKKQAQNS